MAGSEPPRDGAGNLTPGTRTRQVVAMSEGRQAAALAALVGRTVIDGVAALSRTVVRRRTIAVAIGVRLAWVAALVLFIRAGELLLGARAGLHVDEAQRYALVGALACAAAVALGESRRVRWSAWLLGLAHAAAWTLAWTASAA
jgi:hypothetical protein